MAQSFQATPTLQANIAGTSTTVNLRDWLNTRLSPFVKKAMIESLDSGAEYPLQWLGEHLIQQSILFEGNPDSTNIQERFRYKHDTKPPATLVQETASSQAQASSTPQNNPTPQLAQPVNTTASATPESQQTVEPTNVAAPPNPTDGQSDPTPTPVAVPVVNVNGHSEKAEPVSAEDTEMSNAP